MILIRLFAETEAPAFVKAWNADPPPEGSLWRRGLGVMVVSKTADAAAIYDACKSLEPITTSVGPGLMLGPHKEDGYRGYAKRDHWAERAAQFVAIRKAFDREADLAIHLELENFHKDGNEATEAIVETLGGVPAIASAMSPFLDELGGSSRVRQVTPFVCPAVHDDVCLQLIASRVRRIYLLDEDTFAVPNEYRLKDAAGFLDTLKRVHRGRAKMLAKILNGVWVPGFYHEEIFRTWAGRFISEAIATLGVDLFWTFNREKQNAVVGLIPSRAWERGLTANSLNDCVYFPMSKALPQDAWNGETEFKVFRDGVNYYYERVDTATCSRSWSLAFDTLLSGRAASVAGVWQPDATSGAHKEWQLRTDGRDLFFDWFEQPGKDGTLKIAANATDWSRIVVTWNADTKTFAIAANGVNSSIPSSRQVVSNQPIRFGVGTAMIDGKRTRLQSSPLIRDVEYWGRALSVAEIESAKSGHYPRGVIL